MNQITVAVDAPGGDRGEAATLPGCVLALEEDPALHLQLVGSDRSLEPWQSQLIESQAERISVVPSDEVVAMDESVGDALRRRTRSSMGRALQLVFEGSAGAMVSSGNTGALMALARSLLKMLPGVERPAICAALPSRQGHTLALDLGANATVEADHLYQFAHMGVALARVSRDSENPRVGLLNIGTESLKGNDTVRRANQLLSATQLNYQGYAEGHDIFLADLDVVVCDGFSGNVALKCSEGISKLVFEELNGLKQSSLTGRAAAAAARPAFQMLKTRFDPNRYNGASLLGLSGVVVKSHGSAGPEAFANAISTAAQQARGALADRISAELVDLL
ncbi:MAG: phosphate acyltransferase PlsX [Pseudomonadota bacterium]